MHSREQLLQSKSHSPTKEHLLGKETCPEIGQQVFFRMQVVSRPATWMNSEQTTNALWMSDPSIIDLALWLFVSEWRKMNWKLPLRLMLHSFKKTERTLFSTPFAFHISSVWGWPSLVGSQRHPVTVVALMQCSCVGATALALTQGLRAGANEKHRL